MLGGGVVAFKTIDKFKKEKKNGIVFPGTQEDVNVPFSSDSI